MPLQGGAFGIEVIYNVTHAKRPEYEGFMATQGTPMMRSRNQIRSSNVFEGVSVPQASYFPLMYNWLDDTVPAAYAELLQNMDVLTIPCVLLACWLI